MSVSYKSYEIGRVWKRKGDSFVTQWRSNRVCRVCKAHGPTATKAPTDVTLLYFCTYKYRKYGLETRSL